jgi:predicted ArsR family transcriptional regulator
MQSTRSRILAVLKRRGSCTVDEIAQQVALAPMTVRHHLMALERDDLVLCTEERGRTGRPHHVYALSAQGESRFRRHDNYLAKQLVRVVGTLEAEDVAGRSAEEKTDLLFERLADRLVSQHRGRLQRLPVPQRVIAVTELLHEESGFAEWLPADGGWEIRDYNCCYRDLSGSEEGACPWHRRLLAGLLGPEAQPAPDALATVHACRFVVTGEARRAARPALEDDAWRAY